MLSVSNTLKTTLENSVSLNIYSKVVTEWELNAHFVPTVTGPASIDDKSFPLTSVVEPHRTERAGLPKFIVNRARVTAENTWPKYRVPSERSTYKMFHSKSVGNANVSVTYTQLAPCNRILVVFENSFIFAPNVTISITTDGTNWTSLGAFTPDSNGRADIYRQVNGTWTTTPSVTPNYVDIRGVRINMATPVSLIQISPRYQVDQTDRVINASTSRRREDFEFTHPVGRSVASSASVEFSNHDRYFDNAPVNNMMDRNVRLYISDVVVRSDAVHEEVPQGQFFVDEWQLQGDGTATAQATDRGKFLQEVITDRSFYENRTAEFVVRDLIERSGIANYEIRYAPEDENRRMPYIFFDNKETYWDALSSIATAEQANFYFDEQGKFIWESRDYAWTKTASDLVLTNESIGAMLPNVVGFEPQFNVFAEKASVRYAPIAPAEVSGVRVNNVLWEESDTFALTSSPLTSNITLSSTWLTIKLDDWQVFADEGVVNVAGEFIRYKKSTLNPGTLSIRERGLYGSTIKAHNRNPIDNFWSGYSMRRWSGSYEKRNGNTIYGSSLVRDSYVQLTSPGTSLTGESSWSTMQYNGGGIGDSYMMYGTEVEFPVSYRNDGTPYYKGQGIAGIYIHGNGAGDGYYFELLTTQFAIESQTRKAELRAWRRSGYNTYWMNSEAGDLSPPNGRQLTILPGRKYRIEVSQIVNPENERIFTFFVNGVPTLTFKDESSGGTKRTAGYWGVFTRGITTARFDNVWAATVPNIQNLDSFNEVFRNLTDGGFNSGALPALWNNYNIRNSTFVFEDFGPWVYEGREFDVNHEVFPAYSADLWLSYPQDTYSTVLDRDPFGSRFNLFSKSRGTVIVVGDDDTRGGQNNSMFIYGLPLIVQDEKRLEKASSLAAGKQTKEEIEIDSIWTQTKERAQRIIDWLSERWASAPDVVDVDLVVYPPLQLGDVVTVNMPDEGRTTATHKYHVVGIEKQVGADPSMMVTLRRRSN
jgi:hypothetical protein